MNVTLTNQPSKKTVLITGANGFIGSELCAHLSKQGFPILAVLRPSRQLPLEVDKMTVEAIDEGTDWTQALRSIDVVIHLAGRTHVEKNSLGDSLADFRKVNVDGTLNLARQAAASGVRRFIFISSIKVNGENTPAGRPFTALDTPAPADPYGISKHEAELGLMRLAENSGMEIVIIRPPLVYGSGVQGNFLAMMRWLDKGVPLPFGLIRNKRTLVALDNLVDLINTCIKHPAAANQIFLAGDGEDLSTTELLQRLASAMEKKVRLLPVPVWLLNLCLSVLGQRAVAQKLCGSLRVDIDKTRKQLSWTPPVSIDEALRRTVQDYMRSDK